LYVSGIFCEIGNTLHIQLFYFFCVLINGSGHVFNKVNTCKCCLVLVVWCMCGVFAFYLFYSNNSFLSL